MEGHGLAPEDLKEVVEAKAKVETEAEAEGEVATPTPSPDAATGPARGSTDRRVLAALFWLLASLAIMVSGVTLWAHQTLLTSNGWSGIVSEVAADPEVIDDISSTLVTRLSESLGVRDTVEGPPPNPWGAAIPPP